MGDIYIFILFSLLLSPGADITNGVFGSLIVRQADIRDPQRTFYDVDDPNHVILVTHWQHSPEMSLDRGHTKPAILLVNGKGRQMNGPKVPYTTFTVVPGRRHRFRAANAGGAGTCPITISIDNHSLHLITLDGHPIEPRYVTSITLAKGLSKFIRNDRFIRFNAFNIHFDLFHLIFNGLKVLLITSKN